MWGPDVSAIPQKSAFNQVLAVTLGFVGFGYFVYKLAPESPAVPRQYPFSGLVKELGGLEQNKVRLPLLHSWDKSGDFVPLLQALELPIESEED